MSLNLNIFRATAATLVALFSLLFHAANAAAQDSGLEKLPEAGDVVEAYSVAREWVDAFQDLPKIREPESMLAIERGTGACVILRLDGELVGIGWAPAGEDPALMVRRATGRALGNVLRHNTIAALPDDLRSRVGGRLTMELEIAGPLVPLAGLNFGEMVEQIDPGLHGAALRHNNQVAMLFPAALRTTNHAGSIGNMLPNLATEVGLALDDGAQIATRDDVSIYGFNTMHLAQARPRTAPVLTHRGDTIVALESISRDAIADLADGIVRHLLDSRWPDPADGDDQWREPLGMMGDYHPDLDQYRPLVAPPLAQALVALAFARYAVAPDVDADLAAPAGADAARILRELDRVTDIENDPRDDPATCAVIIYALSRCLQCADDEHLEELGADARAVLLGAFNVETGFDPKVHGVARAIVAGGLARLLRMDGAEVIEPELVQLAIEAAWDALPDNLAIGLLPWILWAQQDYVLATDLPMPGMERLRDIIRVLEGSRISMSRQPTPAADLVGGFDLTDHPTALADAQSCRPAAAAAILPRDPQLIAPDQAAAAMGRHLQTIRFLVQLSVRESSWWSLVEPQRALGGIRNAPWDTTQPVIAQALALITAVDTLITLDTLSR